MNKKNITGTLIGVGVIGVLFMMSSGSPNVDALAGDQLQSREQRSYQQKQSAEKIEVIHFHATQQCWSCTTVGEYTLKTIKERFPEEYKNDTIVFRDINGELPENRDMVMKYRAGGSSLYVNAIRSGLDNIEEDTTVWRLVSNEQQFLNYFESKLKRLLGKE